MIAYIILGIIQGLTEFLPVSSSGHLVILKNYLQAEQTQGALLEIMLHLGTLISIFVIFWKDIFQIVCDIVHSLKKLCTGTPPKKIWGNDQHTRLFLLIIIGTIPTGIIALLFEKKFESLFSKPFLAAIAIIITGFVLWFTRIFESKNIGNKYIGVFHALIIGLAQGIAITPGMSRSGLTISAASYMGINRESAVRYSFLLSIPSILAAVFLQLKRTTIVHEQNFMPILIGTATSAIVGCIALYLLVKIVKRGRLYVFSYYCWGFGVISAVFFAIKQFL